MIKRIILLILSIIGSALVIYICINIREESKQNEIKTEMYDRLEALAQQTEIITAAEYTPFIWDAEYPYEYSTRIEKFNILLEGKEAKYIELDEVDHRELYFYHDNLVFDTGAMRVEYWGFWDNRRIGPKDQFDIDKDEYSITIRYFRDEEERKKFYEDKDETGGSK